MTRKLGLWEPGFSGESLVRDAALALPLRQGAVIRALLVRHPTFEPPEPPVSYSIVAQALGVSVSTVKTHLRRARLRQPEIYAAVMAIRAEQF